MTNQPNGSNENVVQVYPENPHYLMFKGKPVLLITSAEHYGGVINWDFDYQAYFAALAQYGLNYTRIYPGAYIEVEGMFIENNTLAPRMGRHLLPWERSSVPGCGDGWNKYDLMIWNEEYFLRLRDFIREAAKYDIVVEICFYNCQYQEPWHVNALNPANNIQGIGPSDFNDYQTLKYPAVVEQQDRYVRKIVQEVNEFDNVVLEIIDEPILKGTSAPMACAWIDHTAQNIVETERALLKKHLIAQQLMVGVDFTTDDRIPLITTQYIRQQSKQIGGVEALETIYHLRKPIECNETAYYPVWYLGDIEAASRAEGWEFIVGGGAAFNHLNGRFTVPNPCGDTPDNQRVLWALKSLKDFMYAFDFPKMENDTTFYGTHLSPGAVTIGSSQPGRQYALYIHHSVDEGHGMFYIAQKGIYQEELELQLLPGRYVASWVQPTENRVLECIEFDHAGGAYLLKSPVYDFDIALSIRAAGSLQGDTR